MKLTLSKDNREVYCIDPITGEVLHQEIKDDRTFSSNFEDFQFCNTLHVPEL